MENDKDKEAIKEGIIENKFYIEFKFENQNLNYLKNFKTYLKLKPPNKGVYYCQNEKCFYFYKENCNVCPVCKIETKYLCKYCHQIHGKEVPPCLFSIAKQFYVFFILILQQIILQYYYFLLQYLIMQYLEHCYVKLIIMSIKCLIINLKEKQIYHMNFFMYFLFQ